MDGRVLAAGVTAGLLAPPLAALPAIRRALRVDLREALEAHGSAVGGQGVTDRALRRFVLLPRSAQIGLRNLGRRKRRSAATAASIATEPLQTAMPCFRPMRAENSFSNRVMNGPSDEIQPVSMHSIR